MKAIVFIYLFVCLFKKQKTKKKPRLSHEKRNHSVSTVAQKVALLRVWVFLRVSVLMLQLGGKKM